MRPHGRAQVSTTNPRAFGVCSRCGAWVNHDELQWQHDWNATRLYNKELLFCNRCLDRPQEQYRTIVLPPDPLPILNARTEPYSTDEAGPVSSQLAQVAQQGTTVLIVQSVSGFYVGQTVVVQMNNAEFASEVITSVNTISNSLGISIPLPYMATPPNIVTAPFSAPVPGTGGGFSDGFSDGFSIQGS